MGDLVYLCAHTPCVPEGTQLQLVGKEVFMLRPNQTTFWEEKFVSEKKALNSFLERRHCRKGIEKISDTWRKLQGHGDEFF